MKHMIYPAALLLGGFLAVSCSGDKKDHAGNENELHNTAPTNTETTVAPAADNKAEIEEYRAKVDVVLKEIDTRIDENKEMKKNEKDKNKKEAYDATIDYLQKLKDELKDKKDKFDDRSTNSWQEFKGELDDIFNRHNNPPSHTTTK